MVLVIWLPVLEPQKRLNAVQTWNTKNNFNIGNWKWVSSLNTNLWLTSDHQENEDSLESIDDVSGIPEVIIRSNNPRNDVQNPSYSHDDDQLQANFSKGGSGMQTVNYYFSKDLKLRWESGFHQQKI